MTAAVRGFSVGRNRTRDEGQDSPPPAGGKKPTTKIDATLLRRANVVSALRGVKLYDYLMSILRPVIEADYKAIPRQIEADDC